MPSPNKLKKPFIAGITGQSGSGKTFLLNKLRSGFAEGNICLLSQDHYYYPKERQSKDVNGQLNFDLPESIDSQALYSDLLKLTRGETITRPEYTFNNPAAKPQLLHVKPAPLIVVEGLFILHYRDILSLIDLSIFVEAPEEICLQRRIRRDREERGYDEQAVRYQWDHHVSPAYRKYLLPYREKADYIILNNTGLEEETSFLVQLLREKISGSR